MLFLIEYDRQRGELVSLREFDKSAWQQAEAARLRLELTLNERATVREVVLLEAQDEQALRQSYRRYFEKLRDIASSSSST